MQLGRWGRPFVSPRGLHVPSCMGWSTGSTPLLSRTARANDDWGEGHAPSLLFGPIVDCGEHVCHTQSGFEQRSSEQCRSSWLSACCRGSSWLGGRMLAGSAPQDSAWCLLSEVEKELGVISMHVVHPKDSAKHWSLCAPRRMKGRPCLCPTRRSTAGETVLSSPLLLLEKCRF